MEEEPKKFSREVRRYKDDFVTNWEDDIHSVMEASRFYAIFQAVLKEHGLDLTKNLKVLEIGSGNAVFLDYLKQQGVNAVGVDVRGGGAGVAANCCTHRTIAFCRGIF